MVEQAVSGITFRGPSVFIQEIEEERPPLFPVFPSNGAVVGFTLKGRTDKAILVTSFDEFVNTFGTFTAKSNVPMAVKGFFDNGGSRLYVVRVVADDAVAAGGDFSTNFRFNSINPGDWGNAIKVTLEGNENYKDISGKKWDKFDVILSEYDPVTGLFEPVERFSAVDLLDEGSASYIVTVLNDERKGSNFINVIKTGGGVPASLLSTDFSNVSIGTGDGVNKEFTFTLNAPVLETTVAITDGSQNISDNGFGKLVGDIDAAGVNTIDYDTGVLTVMFSNPPSAGADVLLSYTRLPKVDSIQLSGGADGVQLIGRNQLTNPVTLKAQKKGLWALLDVKDVLNIMVPDLAGNILAARDQVEFANAHGFSFVVLTTPQNLTPKEVKNFVQVSLDIIDERAAVYYPWIKVVDPLKDSIGVFPPLGHIIGVYARTDRNRTVGKAPAGLDDGLLRGVVGVERVLSRADIDLLYPARVNPIVDFVGLGTILFGARSLHVDVRKRYLQNKRTLNFIELLLGTTLEFMLFESINQQLFARIKLTFESILTNFFQQGMLAGATTDEAFRVEVDRNLNPPEQVEQGIVVVRVGLALTKPAEFFVLQIVRRRTV